MSNRIDRVVKAILTCKDTEGNDLAIVCDFKNGDNPTVSISNDRYCTYTGNEFFLSSSKDNPGLELNISGSISDFNIYKCDDWDGSSDTLDEFLKQFTVSDTIDEVVKQFQRSDVYGYTRD